MNARQAFPAAPAQVSACDPAADVHNPPAGSRPDPGRRHWLRAAALLALPRTAFVHATPAAPRLLVLGGGWGGLAAAKTLRALLPDADITLIDRQTRFVSLPLSNRWLVDQVDEAALVRDRAATARAAGYRFVAAEVLAVDRAARQVDTGAGRFAYDWLVAAPGLREDFSPWFGVDRDRAARCRAECPSGFDGPAGLGRLKALLREFRGGDLLMNIPQLPYRCPPAPYERALLIADWLRREKRPGRLVILDPNLPALAFDRVFRDSDRDRILYLPQTGLRQIDLAQRRVVSDFDTLDFTAAILMPPQRAASFPGLADATDAPWLPVVPDSLQLAGDERVFVVGDAIDRVSPLFGHYPKTGQMAVRQGQLAARQIAARITGHPAATTLPDSTCIVIQRAQPLEMTRIDTRYRRRGDGEIVQTVQQQRLPQASDEDQRWAQGMFAELGLLDG